MTIDQMRRELIAARPTPTTEWREKVAKMTEEKVREVHAELKAFKKLSNHSTPGVYMAQEDIQLPEIQLPEIQPIVQDAFSTAVAANPPIEYAFPNGSLTIRMSYEDLTMGEYMVCSKEALLAGWEKSLHSDIEFGGQMRTVSAIRVISGFIFVDLTIPQTSPVL